MENTCDHNNCDEIQPNENDNITFSPPVYIQRYLKIKDILQEERWQNSISKIIDYGCAELNFFKYIKSLRNIEHVYAVDVDENLIEQSHYKARPLTHEYLSCFFKKLTVDIFAGSIAEPDDRLFNADAVVCIELIEHLYADVLEKLPSTIFEYIRPKLAIFTTPNADFNVLFNLEKFRHYDHKFEWTRKEFEDWAHLITNKYTDYDVYFAGIGIGPEGTEHLGCCSQMAVFYKSDSKLNNLAVPKQAMMEPYKLIHRYEYPYKIDSRSENEKFMCELKYRIHSVVMSKIFNLDDDDDTYKIPLSYLEFYLKEWCPTRENLIDQLTYNDYLVEKSENESYILVNEPNYRESESENSGDESYDNFVTECSRQMEDDWIIT